jgi:hypothetical protein
MEGHFAQQNDGVVPSHDQNVLQKRAFSIRVQYNKIHFVTHKGV